MFNKEIFKKPSFYLIISCGLLCVITAVLPLFIFGNKERDTVYGGSYTFLEPISKEVISLIPEPSQEEAVSSEVSEVAKTQPIASKRVAPTPKNYVKPLEKEEKVVVEPVNEIPVTFTPIKLLDVVYIDQTKLYPSGCESVSAVMALNFAGYSISVNNFIDLCLDRAVTPYIGTDGNYYGYDPREYFLGDPYSEKGWGCKAPVIIKALNRCINHGKNTVENLTGTDFESLKDYIDNDIPVIIWATQGMANTRISKTWKIVDTDKTYTWIAPNHCLLLVGYDDTGYYFNDPLTHKNCRYPADVTENRYNAMGKQAIVILPKAEDDCADGLSADEADTDGNISDSNATSENNNNPDTDRQENAIENISEETDAE